MRLKIWLVWEISYRKRFNLGVGIAAYVQENAEDQWQDLRLQAQKLAEEMVARGEMKAEEARKFVDDMVQQAQNKQAHSTGDRKHVRPSSN